MSTPQLDSDTLGHLEYAFTNHQEGTSNELYALVRSLRAAGWPLAAISAPLGVSRETPRNWANRAVDMNLDLVPVPVPVRRLSKEAAARIEREERNARHLAVLEANLPRLLELQPAAEALRGPSWASPANAAASAEYTQLIDETLKAGVTGPALADALDVAVITIHARLRRSGLRKTAPTEKVPSWARTKDWQHQLEDARMSA